MPLKDLLKKKDKITNSGAAPPPPSNTQPFPTLANDTPEFTFMRTTTTTQEVIAPPSFPGDTPPPSSTLSPTTATASHDGSKRLSSRFRRHSNAGQNEGEGGQKRDRRLSERLHLRKEESTSSVDVPAIGSTVAKTVEEEAEWEKRATLLAKGTPGASTANLGNGGGREGRRSGDGNGNGSRSRSVSVSEPGADVNIQEAIRLHEAGDFDRSTTMFGKLADPNGANNALSQVLYGLALRHGWGCTKNEELAVTYLTYAASNSADVETLALEAGMQKGGAAKGELTLAIFELGNCFRNGWGVKKDPPAAKQYFETAANLGDTDAMNEVAWCYLEGFGCKKDKFKAAQFLRLAEEKGSKTVGNTWIWKDKYSPKP